MSVRISKGSISDCLENLEDDSYDSEEYPIKSYKKRGDFSLLGRDIPVVQGVNATPKARFTVDINDNDASYAGTDIPGIVPFLGSTKQVSPYWHRETPTPTEIGLPNLTGNTSCLIRWIFEMSNRTNEGRRLWARIDPDDLEDVDDSVLPDQSVEAGKRNDYNPTPAFASPEPVEFVEPRIDNIYYEPWLARSIEMANSWRVVVPAKSQSIIPVIVPPTFTVVGQNFNVILCPNGRLAVAISTVLGRESTVEYLKGLPPWSRGGTPIPRSKHVYAALWEKEDEIISILDRYPNVIELLSSSLSHFWETHINALIWMCREPTGSRIPLRQEYISISDNDVMDSIPTGILGLDENSVLLSIENGSTVKIDFSSPDISATASSIFWAAFPLKISLRQILDIGIDRNDLLEYRHALNIFGRRYWLSLQGRN